MTKYMYLYRGPVPDATDLSAEQSAERMAAFGAWMAKLGPALVDVGAPFGHSAAVRDDATDAVAGEHSGYTIIEAEDLETARALTEGLPFLSRRDGTCTVEIYELRSL